MGFRDLPLCALDVIADPPELKRLLIHVPHPIARHRATVSRLAHAAGIDEGGPTQSERVDAIVVCHLAPDQAEDSGNWSVSVEADAAVDDIEVGSRDRGIQDVLVDVVSWARVHEQDVIL